MGRAFLAQLIGLVAACGSGDRAAPVLVGAEAVPGNHLGVANAGSPLSGLLVETGTRPMIALMFSERLDGDAIEEVVTDPDTGAVRDTCRLTPPC